MPARLRIFFLFLLLLASFAFVAEDDIPEILSRLEKFRKSYPQEKIHLHLDKPYYSIGDTIYFKAYVVNAERNRPTAISNILYVDVIDEQKRIRQTLRRPITDGISWGTVELADSLSEGNYRIRAYTNWMRNFDEAYFFDRQVAVGAGLDNAIIASASVMRNSSKEKGDSLRVSYQSMHGSSLSGNEVTYSIRFDQKEVQKGKGQIDAAGRLRIGLTGNHPRNQPLAEIVTRIKIDNKNTITKLIPFAMPVKQYAVQFFPEGGQLINDLPACIGFKAVNGDGSGADVSGEIGDDSSGTRIAFKSGFAGMGRFQFTPQSGHSYHALVRYKDGTEEKKALPKAVDQGYVLAADNAGPEKVTITIAAKGTKPFGYVTLIAQNNNRTYFSETISLMDGSATVAVSKKKFPSGIVQFTLFGEALRPVAERLVFINHQDALRIGMLLNQASYNKREQVQMTLAVKDSEGNPVMGNFSVAVTDGNAVPHEKTKGSGLLSNLLLTSDLRGSIEQPDYYFTDITDEKQRELDNLLLTQGWRRFEWKEVLADKYPATPFAVEKNLAVSGNVLSLKGEPVAAAKVTLLSKNGTGFMLDAVTGADGSFTFNDFEFTDDKPFVVQAETAAGRRDVQVKLTGFVPAPVGETKKFPGAGNGSSALQPYLVYSARRYGEMKKFGLLQNNANMLEEVTVKAQRLTKVQEAVAPSANLNGPGNADQILTYEELRNCSDLGQCLQGKIRGVIFKLMVDPNENPRFQVPKLMAYSALGMGKPMLVILDGMDLSTGSSQDIRNIPAGNIQSIEVLRSGAYLSVYGTRASGGVLVVTTKKGNIDYNAGLYKKAATNNSNTLFTTAKGFTSYRKFYTPDYSRPVGATMPDLRSTVYWQPNVETDDNGKATLSFYNADNPATYNIIIEGITADGKLGTAFFTYEVK